MSPKKKVKATPSSETIASIFIPGIRSSCSNEPLINRVITSKMYHTPTNIGGRNRTTSIEKWPKSDIGFLITFLQLRSNSPTKKTHDEIVSDLGKGQRILIC